MKKTYINLLLIAIIALCSCQEPQNQRDVNSKKQAKNVTIKHYKQRNPVNDNDPTNDWLFWYLIMHNNGSCNYYYSNSPVTDYSSVSWSKSDKLPEDLAKDINNPEVVQEQETQQVAVNDLSNEMQTEIDTTPDDYQGMTYEELGDYENATQDIDNQPTDNTTSESYDSGSSDGGGDGGGGGE